MPLDLSQATSGQQPPVQQGGGLDLSKATTGFGNQQTTNTPKMSAFDSSKAALAQSQSKVDWLGKAVDIGLPVAGGLVGALAASPTAFLSGPVGPAVGGGIGAAAGKSIANLFDQLTGRRQPTIAQTIGEPLQTGIIQGLGGKAFEAAGALAPQGAGILSSEGTIGSQLLNSGGRIAAQGITGAVVGAGAGAAQGQTSPKELGQNALLGGLLSGGIATAGEVGSGVLNNMASKTTESRLNEQTDRLAKLRNSADNNTTFVKDPQTGQVTHIHPIETLMKEGALPTVNELGKVQTMGEGGAVENLQGKIDTLQGKASEIVNQLPGGVPKDRFLQDVTNEINNSKAIRSVGAVTKAEAQAESMFKSYGKSYADPASGIMPYDAINEIKVGVNKVYDPAERDVARIVGDVARKYLYSADAGGPELQNLMSKEGTLINAKSFAEDLHGTTVKGGSLGKYFATLLGAGVGGTVTAGTGGLGAGIGGVAGAAAANKALGMMQSRYFNPVGSQTAAGLQSVVQNPAIQTGLNATKTGVIQQATKK